MILAVALAWIAASVIAASAWAILRRSCPTCQQRTTSPYQAACEAAGFDPLAERDRREWQAVMDSWAAWAREAAR